MGLERLVGRVELLSKMFAARRRDLAEDGDGALELACGYFLKIDLVLLQKSMEVRHGRDHADRADDRKGRSEAIAGHRAARTVDPDHRFVGLGPGGDEDGVDFRPEALDRTGAHVALE